MTEAAQPKPPRHQEVADELRAAIERGDFSKTGKLPSETELTKQFGNSRGTIRDALAILATEDLTESRKGSGVYLRRFERIHRDIARRLARSNWGAGRAVWDEDLKGRRRTEDVTVEEVEAPEEIAATFGLPPGSRVWRRSRTHYADAEKRPVQLSVSYYPADLVAGSAITRRDTGAGGVLARLADLGHAPARFREEVKARLPFPEETKRLAITKDTPVFTIARTAFDADGQPVEVAQMVLDSNAYVLLYNFTS